MLGILCQVELGGSWLILQLSGQCCRWNGLAAAGRDQRWSEEKRLAPGNGNCMAELELSSQSFHFCLCDSDRTRENLLNSAQVSDALAHGRRTPGPARADGASVAEAYAQVSGSCSCVLVPEGGTDSIWSRVIVTVKYSGFQSSLCHLLAVCLWANYSAFLYFIFPIWNVDRATIQP